MIYLSSSLKLLILFAVLDVVLVMFFMLALANGVELQHIPFWDDQMQFVVQLLN